MPVQMKQKKKRAAGLHGSAARLLFTDAWRRGQAKFVSRMAEMRAANQQLSC